MTHDPVVSIFVPVFNGDRYLAETLHSLLSQTYERFEIIVVNDGSTDKTAEIAESFRQQDARIRIFHHATNRGLSAARNSGITAASSQTLYLMNHDSDDISLPNKLQTLVQYLEDHPEIAAVGSRCSYIDENGKYLGEAFLECRPSMIRATFGFVNSMAISATLIRRSLLDAAGPFRGEYGSCDDYDFWARSLAAGYRFANIPLVLHSIRRHRASMTTSQPEEMRRQSARINNEYHRAQRWGAGKIFLGRCLHMTLRPRSILKYGMQSFHGSAPR